MTCFSLICRHFLSFYLWVTFFSFGQEGTLEDEFLGENEALSDTPSAEIAQGSVPIAGGTKTLENLNDPSIKDADDFIMERVNAARKRCQKPLFTNAEAVFVMSQPGKGTLFLMEVSLTAEDGSKRTVVLLPFS